MSFTATVTLLILLSVSSKAELSCYGLELISTLSTDTVVVPPQIFPFDVCTSSLTYLNQNDVITEYGVSYMYTCSNGVPYLSSYQQANCEGAFSSVAIDESLYQNMYTVNAYCDAPACDVVNVGLHTSVDYDCTDPSSATFTSSVQTAFISDFCNVLSSMMSAKWSCDGTEAQYQLYLTPDCSGDVYQNVLYDISHGLTCDEATGYNVAGTAVYDFECGTAGSTLVGGVDNSSGSNTGGSNTGGSNTGGSNTGDDDDAADDDAVYNNGTQFLCNLYGIICALLFCGYVL